MKQIIIYLIAISSLSINTNSFADSNTKPQAQKAIKIQVNSNLNNLKYLIGKQLLAERQYPISNEKTTSNSIYLICNKLTKDFESLDTLIATNNKLNTKYFRQHCNDFSNLKGRDKKGPTVIEALSELNRDITYFEQRYSAQAQTTKVRPSVPTASR